MLLVLLFIVIIFVLIVGIKYLWNYYLIIKYLRKLPGPPSDNFVIGNVKPVYGASPQDVFKVQRFWGLTYNPIYQLSMLHITSANIVNPYDFETILSNVKNNEKSPLYKMLHKWLGTGLLTSYGPKWQRRRKILTPAFHFNILQHFVRIFVDKTEKLVNVLKKEAHRPYVEITTYISEFTLDTIGATAMGFDFTQQSVQGSAYKNAIYQIGKIYFFRAFRPWLWKDLLYVLYPEYYKEKSLVKSLHNFTTNVITKRQENFKSKLVNGQKFVYSNQKRLAMLDLLLTARNEEHSIDDVGIREEVDTFMFEGHDTTSVALSFALMLIACHKDIQEQIVGEIGHVLGDQKPNYNNLNEMKYLERCIKEALRLYPSVHFIARYLGEDMVTHCGHLLKAGSMLHLYIYDLHHNPTIYPDPEKFDPDRFLTENSKGRHPFAYLPFSAGPRNCIGQKFAMFELKAAICGILSEFILEPVDTPETIVLIPDLVLRTKDPIRIRLVPRAKAASEN